MAQYSLQSSSFQQNQVGSIYNIGISNGTQSYGYLLQNKTGPQLVEKTNITDKQAQIQYSSPNLIDRDLVYYPRVTQGDFSGGTLQAVFTDPTKVFDTDLEIRTPGYLTLRPGWSRTTLVASGTTPLQCAAVNSTVYTVNGVSHSVWAADGTSIATNPDMVAKLCDTDGQSLIVADGVNKLIYYNFTAAAWSTVSLAIGAIQQMWFVSLGTQNRYLYYTVDNLNLLAWDAGGGGATGIVIPTKGPYQTIVDLCGYQNGLCIVTKDIRPGGSGDVWFHDGVNMTRIVHLAQETPVGVCNCLGTLYLTTNSTGAYEAPSLYKIDSGTLTKAVRVGSPLASLTAASIGAPITSSQYVYFVVKTPQINNITAVNYVAVYDHVSGAYTHLGRRDAFDNPQTDIRSMATSGRAVAVTGLISGSTTLQYQSNTQLLPAGGNTYTGSGSLVSSKLDFGTPIIPKRFRRIEVVHSPLASGESVLVKAFVDLDPLDWTSGLTPSPSGATVTNSTVGSTVTTLTMGGDTVGKTLYYSLTLSGGGSSTPRVNRTGVEIGGTWTWEFDLDCTAIRRTLSGGDDTQGVSGKDLYYLLRNAYENGGNLTLYLNQGVSYTVTIEQLETHAASYVDHLQSPVKGDQEWLVHATLKQVA